MMNENKLPEIKIEMGEVTLVPDTQDNSEDNLPSKEECMNEDTQDDVLSELVGLDHRPKVKEKGTQTEPRQTNQSTSNQSQSPLAITIKLLGIEVSIKIDTNTN